MAVVVGGSGYARLWQWLVWSVVGIGLMVLGPWLVGVHQGIGWWYGISRSMAKHWFVGIGSMVWYWNNGMV